MLKNSILVVVTLLALTSLSVGFVTTYMGALTKTTIETNEEGKTTKVTRECTGDWPTCFTDNNLTAPFSDQIPDLGTAGMNLEFNSFSATPIAGTDIIVYEYIVNQL